MFCNAGPIAASCYLGKDIVSSAHAAVIQAIGDLTTLGYDLNIDFGFVKLVVRNKDLTYKFQTDFSGVLNSKSYELKMRKSDLPTSDHWKTTYEDKWAKSSLNTLLKRPNPT